LIHINSNGDTTMTIQLEVTKRELDFLLRGMSALLIDENERSTRRNGEYKPTKNYLAAEELESRLIKAASAAERQS